MKLIIYVNDNFEEERALFDLDEEKVLLKGDDYHDKIHKMIEGYLQALEDCNIHNENVETKWIDSDHTHYEMMEFYAE